ncbi:unnamed protein product [Peniophora sp. CBMAI 1063]|nr:unnamed protein product [Peniophora sp. CBMAI 1063]
MTLCRPLLCSTHTLTPFLHTRLASTSSSSSPYPFPQTRDPSPWQIFHLQPSASQSDIKARYYALVRLYHPDSPSARALPPDVAHRRFQAVRAAYDTLTGKAHHPSSSHYHPHGSAHTHDSDDLWRELAARRRQQERREAYRRAHGVPEWDAAGDDARKDRILFAVGCLAVVVGVAPAFANWTEHRDAKHRLAAANLTAARGEAREFAAARREGIRSRMHEEKVAAARAAAAGREDAGIKPAIDAHTRALDLISPPPSKLATSIAHPIMSASTWSISYPDKQKLISAAIAAKDGSYSPYSKFRVGAALLSADGQIIKGANIENASYGGTICAERTALVKAVSEGTKSFVGLAVTSDVDDAISPCGICRQVIREFCALSMPIYLVPSSYSPNASNADERVLETTIDKLLPHSFGPEHLELPRPGGGK